MDRLEEEIKRVDGKFESFLGPVKASYRHAESKQVETMSREFKC